MKWYLRVMLENYANFSGRARRREYWMFSLFFFIVCMALLFLTVLLFLAMGDTVNYTSNEWVNEVLAGLWILFFAAHILPGFALTIRRLHDIGKSGWWYLVAFIPYVGSLIIFIFSVMPGQVGENTWGPDPKVLETSSKQKAPGLVEEVPKEEANN